MDISIIIPVRNEEQGIPELSQRLKLTLNNLELSYELIFVTDTNEDNTFEVLVALNKEDRRIKTVKLTKGAGQHIAVVAGLHLCKGQSVVIMDGDLQDYPEDIPKLYEELKKGYSVVYGEKKRKDDSLIRCFFSKLFIVILNKLSDADLKYNTSMFRIISRQTVDTILQFREREPSLTFIMSLIGFSTSSVQVTSGQRKTGKTKYNFLRSLNFAINSLVSFSTKPLRIMSMIGFFIAGASLVYLVIILIQKLFYGIPVFGWTTIISLITFLGGMQIIGIGLIGEYVGRTFIEAKQRPLFIIEDEIGNFE